MNFSIKGFDRQSENKTILQQIAAGDQHGVQKCLEEYGGLVWYLADKFAGKTGDTEDAVQEIFIAIWQNAGRFDPEKGKESAFITLIARRRLIDRLRKKMSKPETVLLDENILRSRGNSERQMQARLEAKRAGQVLMRFNPKQRKVLNMAIYEGYTHLEIAEALGLPLGTVKTLLRRGFQKIRKSLRQNSFSQTAAA
ncbi:MAG: sigma-70 family RNA polymerase sigma factor [Pyrinomonadaceae bacterium]